MSEEAIERLVPRQVPAPPTKPPAIDAGKIGQQASLAISSCAESIQHIKSMLASVSAAAGEITKTGESLIEDLEGRMNMMESVVRSFAELSAGSAKRMAAERDLLKAVAGDARRDPEEPG